MSNNLGKVNGAHALCVISRTLTGESFDGVLCSLYIVVICDWNNNHLMDDGIEICVL